MNLPSLTLALMDHAVRDLVEQYSDIVFAFGESDEFMCLLTRITPFSCMAELLFPS
jgi:tRNA(His) 5'-end guanylyltransferase